MSDIHRTLEILGQAVASMLDRIESLEAENAALLLMVRPAPIVPVAEQPVRDLSLADLDLDRE